VRQPGQDVRGARVAYIIGTRALLGKAEGVN